MPDHQKSFCKPKVTCMIRFGITSLPGLQNKYIKCCTFPCTKLRTESYSLVSRNKNIGALKQISSFSIYYYDTTERQIPMYVPNEALY